MMIKNKKFLVLPLVLLSIIVCILSVLLFEKIIERNHARELISAIESNDVDKLELLLKMDISPNSKPFFFHWIDNANSQPINTAANLCNYNAVQLLVEAGADVNASDDDKMTPLHYASIWNDESVIYYLIEHDADINKKNCNGDTPFELLFYFSRAYCNEQYNIKRFNIAMMFIEKGAELYNTKSLGCIMFQAASGDDDVLLDYLIFNYDVNVNAKSTDAGRTALMFASMRGSVHACVFLIDHNADLSISDSYGKTAYDYAIENGYYELAELLKP